jgi:hypothetical protein
MNRNTLQVIGGVSVTVALIVLVATGASEIVIWLFSLMGVLN